MTFHLPVQKHASDTPVGAVLVIHGATEAPRLFIDGDPVHISDFRAAEPFDVLVNRAWFAGRRDLVEELLRGRGES